MTEGLVSSAELEAAIVTEFNPIRVGFAGGPDMWVRDILNLGVHPWCALPSVLRIIYTAAYARPAVQMVNTWAVERALVISTSNSLVELQKQL